LSMASRMLSKSHQPQRSNCSREMISPTRVTHFGHRPPSFGHQIFEDLTGMRATPPAGVEWNALRLILSTAF
jgi:hypothetical protein